MKPETRHRKCLHCKRLFDSDYRNRTRQKYCSAPECRQASKRASQARWLSQPANRDYFRDATTPNVSDSGARPIRGTGSALRADRALRYKIPAPHNLLLKKTLHPNRCRTHPALRYKMSATRKPL